LLRSELKIFSVRVVLLLALFTILMVSLPDATAQIPIWMMVIVVILFNMNFLGPEFKFNYENKR